MAASTLQKEPFPGHFHTHLCLETPGRFVATWAMSTLGEAGWVASGVLLCYFSVISALILQIESVPFGTK